MSAPLSMRAAIFDLDGTLLDSMYVWHAVDERFFAERGLTLTPDYAKAIAGMSYRETALYTKKRYGLTPSAFRAGAIPESDWNNSTELE